MKNSQQGFLSVVIIVLIALAVGGGAYYVVSKNKVVPKTQVVNTGNLEATTTIETKLNFNKSNWKTYTNAGVGFTLMLPPDWQLIRRYMQGSLFGFGPRNEKSDFEEKLIFFGGSTVIYPDKEPDQNINGILWNIRSVTNDKGNLVRYSTMHNNVKYDFEFHKEDQEIVKKILSTFTFTNTVWKEYSSSVSEFLYPNTLTVEDKPYTDKTTINLYQNDQVYAKFEIDEPDTYFKALKPIKEEKYYTSQGIEILKDTYFSDGKGYIVYNFVGPIYKGDNNSIRYRFISYFTSATHKTVEDTSDPIVDSMYFGL